MVGEVSPENEAITWGPSKWDTMTWYVESTENERHDVGERGGDGKPSQKSDVIYEQPLGLLMKAVCYCYMSS